LLTAACTKRLEINIDKMLSAQQIGQVQNVQQENEETETIAGEE
jgi:hypothetical protein